MKKRFTVMLDTKVIAKIKRLNEYYTPYGVRETLEIILNQSVTKELKLLEGDKND